MWISRLSFITQIVVTLKTDELSQEEVNLLPFLSRSCNSITNSNIPSYVKVSATRSGVPVRWVTDRDVEPCQQTRPTDQLFNYAQNFFPPSGCN